MIILICAKEYCLNYPTLINLSKPACIILCIIKHINLFSMESYGLKRYIMLFKNMTWIWFKIFSLNPSYYNINLAVAFKVTMLAENFAYDTIEIYASSESIQCFYSRARL